MKHFLTLALQRALSLKPEVVGIAMGEAMQSAAVTKVPDVPSSMIEAVVVL